MAELTIDQALQQAVEAHKAGQVQEADRLYTAILKAQPKHPDANHNMGVLAVGVGKVEQALPFFKTALEANPATAQFWLSYIDALIKLDKSADAKAVLDQAKSKGAKGDGFDKLEQRLKEAGEEPMAASKTVGKASKIQDPPQDQLQSLINLYSQGQLQQALKQAETLVKQFPQSAILFNIQGAVLKGLGQLELSVDAYNKALAIKPDYAEAYNNMGVTLQEQGKLEEAIETYNKALTIKPDNAEAYYNMGNALQDQGKLEEAIEAYNKALAIKPDYADAYNNMGVILKDQGKLEEAIETYNKALAIKPDYADAYINMGNALQGVVFKQPNPGLQKIITSLLNKKSYVRPRDIAYAAISLLKFEPKLKQHLQTSSLAEPEPKLLEAITDLCELPLLLKLMSVCPLPDLELENLFSELRASLLVSISDLTGSPGELKFQSALALQCFTNEYVYNQSEHEDSSLADLEVAVKQALSNGDQPSPQSILCLASYRPLNQYEWSSLLRITNKIEDVFTRQVVEPNQEAQFKTVLPVLEEITDEVSSKVRDQYEVSPYPRWVNLGLRLQPAPISKLVEEIKLKLFDDAIKEVEAPNILIAGCGTGLHSIGTAARFKGSNVLAIDLSLSSLSYAKRKTEELGIQNIDYMQADILDLGKLNRQFDIVESAGVLHHMEDPVAGWRVLTDCLKPGGLMKIGLYSELARQHIVEMRQEINQLGTGSSDLAMKSFRTGVITSDLEHHNHIVNSPDFYSLSTLRDLLFHVQEHRFTIPKLKQCIEELGLKFCGFENASVVQKSRLTNIGPDDPYDLDKWQTYEEANPHTFAGMYQFWCQKVA